MQCSVYEPLIDIGDESCDTESTVETAQYTPILSGLRYSIDAEC